MCFHFLIMNFFGSDFNGFLSSKVLLMLHSYRNHLDYICLTDLTQEVTNR